LACARSNGPTAPEPVGAWPITGIVVATLLTPVFVACVALVVFAIATERFGTRTGTGPDTLRPWRSKRGAPCQVREPRPLRR
jgi:hypothetical protein